MVDIVKVAYMDQPPSLKRTLQHYRWLYMRTQQTTAETLGVSRATLAGWETGQRPANYRLVWRGVVATLGLDWQQESLAGAHAAAAAGKRE